MTETIIYSWIKKLLGSSCICAFLLFICPEGKGRHILETGVVCVMLLSALSIAGEFDPACILNQIYTFEATESLYWSEYDVSAAESTRAIIEKNYTAYVLNEAKVQGVVLENASIQTVQTKEGTWIPYSVMFRTKELIPDSFRRYIQSNLGIPYERQYTDENE